MGSVSVLQPCFSHTLVLVVPCRILLWREFLSVTRNPADVAGRCLIFSWLAIFVGLIYYNLSPNVDSLRARLNVLFVEPVILLLLPYVYMSLYTADKQYYIADSSAKLYHPSAYYVAKQMAVLPFAVLNVLLFSFTLYGLAGLRHEGWAVGVNGLMSVLMYLIAAQVGGQREGCGTIRAGALQIACMLASVGSLGMCLLLTVVAFKA